ncbi:MAG: pyruvate kinase [Thermotoga sp. 4484_232]|nr:MAG: pyruvate kinase [Thermotoga sp. 4484_232]
MRRTKIVCTIGPVTGSKEMIEKMIDAGMNVARLNTSHGDLEDHRKKIKLLKEVRKEKGVPLAILLDLAGPKIRTGYLNEDYVELEEGQVFYLTTEEMIGNREIVSVNCKELARDVKKGDRILLSDGAIELEVLETDGVKIKTIVKNGGRITHVDYFAVSFVRKKEDVQKLKDILKERNCDIPVIAKIETKQALQNLEEIAKVSDGLMVARGDLGVEVPIEEVPMAQKRIIELANRLAKPAITATQILESMVNNPRPTRAEITDIANAILDGTDALMLSDETAVGKYPIPCIKVMDCVARKAEESLEFYRHISLDWLRSFSTVYDISDAISHACWQLSEDLGVKLIITSTSSGSTARRVARFRPKSLIVATTPFEKTYHRLSLVWGVLPLIIDEVKTTDDLIEKSLKKVKERKLAEEGDVAIVTAGIPPGKPGTTNMVKVQKV